MLISQNFKTISDMRLNPVALLNSAANSSDPTYLTYRSKPKAVLLSLEEYQKLQEIYHDYLDAKEAGDFEKQDKKKVKWLDFDEVFDR